MLVHTKIIIALNLLLLPICAIAAEAPDNGSTIVTPLSNPNTMILQSNVASVPVIGKNGTGDYSQFNVCPTNPVCPDADGRIPAGSVENCPNECTVTRNPATIPNGYVSTVTEATCPADYISSGVYNSQLELSYNPNYTYYQNGNNGTPYGLSGSPIPGMGTLTYLENQGYTCAPAGYLQTQHLPSYCTASGWPADPWYNTWTEGNFAVSITTDQLSGTEPPGSVVDLVWRYSNDYCKIAPYCYYACYGVTHDVGVAYKYYYYQCYLPPGYRSTGKYIPVSVLCTHAATNWCGDNNNPCPP